ncbi:hypothetical protein GDO81_009127 [Engystomops pustulosus]|uniref:Uncharacterized protein n=1 Tax=Engystomops pustulosus TaxID=76066 RepID=A0AAV7BNY6_ENGPU|nr:hypothetical protein GDO81_009127 [Engystomops pustulosus]
MALLTRFLIFSMNTHSELSQHKRGTISEKIKTASGSRHFKIAKSFFISHINSTVLILPISFPPTCKMRTSGEGHNLSSFFTSKITFFHLKPLTPNQSTLNT